MYSYNEATNAAFTYISLSAGKTPEEIDTIYDQYVESLNQKPLDRDIFHKLAADFEQYDKN